METSANVKQVLQTVLSEIDVELAALRLQRVGVEAALARVSVSAAAQPHGTGSTEREAAATPNGRDPVEAVLIQAGGVIGVRKIEEQVRASGSNLSEEQIRSRISYLSRKGRIKRAGERGTWVHKSLLQDSLATPGGVEGTPQDVQQEHLNQQVEVPSE